MKAVYFDMVILFGYARVLRCADGKMVSFNLAKIQQFLHSNTNGRAAAPDPDDEVRTKTAFDDKCAEL